MKPVLSVFIFFLMYTLAFRAEAQSLTLVGNIPGQYLNLEKNKTFFGFVEINQRKIVKLEKLDPKAFNVTAADDKVIFLGPVKRSNYGMSADPEQFDVIYPGLINLHNHTKQNNLPVWADSKGQFNNRFEWRDFKPYKNTVSNNINPWVNFGTVSECAVYRWSEMQAMVGGTTFLQGPSSCIEKFAIHRVEDPAAYVSEKLGVSAPTDLVVPEDMTFVWNVLGPEIRRGKSYEKVLSEIILKHCPSLTEFINETSVNLPAGLDKLKDQEALKAACTENLPLPDKFIRYVYYVHPTIANRKKYLSNPQHAAFIVHLAEGRSDDSYNKTELDTVKLLGLDLKDVIFVHGVGIDAAGFKHMAGRGMGLVWSPFSNLLLYSDTLNIKAAKEQGVLMALGSDWLPTGTRTVLEELKVAKEFVLKDSGRKGLASLFTDEELYKMVTENPARLINHWEISEKEAGVGRLAIGAMGSVIAVSKKNPNPHTNLVVHAFEKDINLVVIDGKPVYGNTDYLSKAGLSFETISDDIAGVENVLTDTSIPKPPKDEALWPDHLIKLATLSKSIPTAPANGCGFQVKKGFVHQNSIAEVPELKNLRATTQVNFDRYMDIAKFIALNLLTQNKNLSDPSVGVPASAIKKFPTLYSCNDADHLARVRNFVRSDGVRDEWDQNSSQRDDLRTQQKAGNSFKSTAEKYNY